MKPSEKFYDSEGNLTEEGRFLEWLDANGPKKSKELVKFPGGGRNVKADREPVINWLRDNEFIDVYILRDGSRGHPATMHEVTVRGRDWAEILRMQPEPAPEPDEDVTSLLEQTNDLLERVASMEAQFTDLMDRLAALTAPATKLRAVG